MEDMPFQELLARQQVTAVIVIVFALLLTIEFIRRRALMERYAILWLLASFVLIPMVLWFDLVAKLAQWIGIAYPPSMVLLTASLFIILILFHLTVALSQAKRHETKIVLQLAEQQEELEKLRQRVGELEKKEPPEAPVSGG